MSFTTKTNITLLPDHFKNWFAKKGWHLRPHQLALLKRTQAQQSTLLIAPTGAGKTLAGFLPSLIDIHDKKTAHNLHTLYISP